MSQANYASEIIESLDYAFRRHRGGAAIVTLTASVPKLFKARPDWEYKGRIYAYGTGCHKHRVADCDQCPVGECDYDPVQEYYLRKAEATI